MQEDIYRKLREFLDAMPGGYPATDSGVEITILKKLFTPEQAALTMKLGPLPEPIAEIAKKAGIDEGEALEKYEEMAKQGLIFRVRKDDLVAYCACSFVVGIYEFHLNTIDRELAELFEEYLPVLTPSLLSVKTKGLRIVPVQSAVDATPEVASYEQIYELVKDKTMISVAPCICQKEQELLGKSCDRPAERCLQFGTTARYYIENGMARRIDLDELMEILKMGEENALVLSPTNTKRIAGMCLCCDCCCPLLRTLGQYERPIDHVRTAYQAEIDPELCSACGTCEDRCQIDALEEGEDCYEIDDARCIGCGLCVPTCPEEAISLVELADPAPVPENIVELGMNIMKDRGLL